MATVNRQAKYLALADVRVWYDATTDSIKVTSPDPILGGGGMTLSVKKDTHTDTNLRNALLSTGVMSMPASAPDDRRLERPIAFSDYARDLIRPRVPGREQLTFSLGRRVDNVSLDFSFVNTGMPHLLVCGGTNSGKVDLIRSMMRQLAEANGREELNMWVFDDGGDYEPMYNVEAIHEIVTDGITQRSTVAGTAQEEVAALLDKAVHEMNYRFQAMREHPRSPNSLRAARDLARRGEDDAEILHAPFIVIIADLTVCEEANREALLKLIYQARTAGIFLVLTTWEDQLQIRDQEILDRTHPVGMVGSSAASRRLLGAAGMESLPLVAGLTPVDSRLTAFRTYDYPDSGEGLSFIHADETDEHVDVNVHDLLDADIDE